MFSTVSCCAVLYSTLFAVRYVTIHPGPERTSSVPVSGKPELGSPRRGEYQHSASHSIISATRSFNEFCFTLSSDACHALLVRPALLTCCSLPHALSHSLSSSLPLSLSFRGFSAVSISHMRSAGCSETPGRCPPLSFNSSSSPQARTKHLTVQEDLRIGPFFRPPDNARQDPRCPCLQSQIPAV